MRTIDKAIGQLYYVLLKNFALPPKNWLFSPNGQGLPEHVSAQAQPHQLRRKRWRRRRRKPGLGLAPHLHLHRCALPHKVDAEACAGDDAVPGELG